MDYNDWRYEKIMEQFEQEDKKEVEEYDYDLDYDQMRLDE